MRGQTALLRKSLITFPPVRLSDHNKVGPIPVRVSYSSFYVCSRVGAKRIDFAVNVSGKSGEALRSVDAPTDGKPQLGEQVRQL